MICNFCLIPADKMPASTRILALDDVNICSSCIKDCSSLLKEDTEDKVIVFNFQASHKKKLELAG